MQTHPTSYADINVLLAQLLLGMQKILDTKLVGLYLYGSLVTGDFDSEISDIDLLAAISSDLNDKEFAALHQMQTDFVHQHKAWEGRIEIAYLSVTALKTYKLRTSKMALIHPGEPFHIRDAGDDWLINWYTVREKGVALFGPSPKVLIEPISQQEYKRAVKVFVKAWREQIEGGQAYAILTMCRALYSLKVGELVSKKQAALWAAKEMPEWSVLIQNALVWRTEWRNEHVDHDATFPETVRFVNAVIDQCEQYKIQKD